MIAANIIIAILALYALIAITKILSCVKEIDQYMEMAFSDTGVGEAAEEFKESGCWLEVYSNGHKVTDKALAIYVVDKQGNRAYLDTINTEERNEPIKDV